MSRPASVSHSRTVVFCLTLLAWAALGCVGGYFWHAHPASTTTTRLSKTIKSGLPEEQVWLKALDAPTYRERVLAVNALVVVTPVNELGTLLDHLPRTSVDDRILLRELIYAHWAAAQPEAAFAHLQANVEPNEADGVWEAAFGTWAKADGMAAQAAAASLLRDDMRQRALGHVFAAWAAVNSDLAEAAWQAWRPTPAGKADWLGVLTVMADTQPKIALAWLADVDWRGASPLAAQQLFTVLARSDPQAAWTAAVALEPDNPSRLPAAVGVLYAYASGDLPGAIDTVEHLADTQFKAAMIPGVLGVLAERDAAGAYQLWQEIPVELRTLDPLRTIVSNWAIQDFDGAMEAMGQLVPLNFRARATTLIVLGRGRSDLEGTVAWVMANLPAAQQPGLLMSLITDAAPRDPTAAVSILNTIPLTAEQATQLYSNVARVWGYQDLRPALAWAASQSDPAIRATAIRQAFSAATEQGPLAAAEILGELQDVPDRDTLMNILMSAWTKMDPLGGFAWAQANLSPVLFYETGNKLLANWCDANPAAAAPFIEQLAQDPANMPLFKFPPSSKYSGGNPPSNLAGLVARDLAFQNAPGALEWAKNLPEGSLRDMAINATLRSLVEVDPSQVWDYVKDATGTGPVVGVRATLLRAMPPEQAMALASSMTNEQDRLNSISTVVRNWVGLDPQAASEWINMLSPGPERDQSVDDLLRSEGGYDLSTTMRWALSISDPSRRARQMNNIATSWASLDLAALEEVVNTADLTPEEKRLMTQTITVARRTNSAARPTGR